MTFREQTSHLAYLIGLCRIALVVDQVQHNMRSHHALAKLFRFGAPPDQRARLTYFWWIVLGGRELRAAALGLLPAELRSAITPKRRRAPASRAAVTLLVPSSVKNSPALGSKWPTNSPTSRRKQLLSEVSL
jgi:hypothetical protein